MNLGTWLFTLIKGRRVGTDAAGNIYYRERRPRPDHRGRRWVAYAGPAEASKVPPEWHAWLHYTTDAPLTDAPRRPLAAAAPAERHRHGGRLPSARPRLPGRKARPRQRRLRSLDAGQLRRIACVAMASPKY